MTEMSIGALIQQYQQEEEITLLEKGKYELEAVSCSVRGKTGGNPGIMPIWRVVSGPLTGRRVMAGSFTLTDKSRSIFFRNLAGLGFTTEALMADPRVNSMQPLEFMEWVAQQVPGRVCEVDIVIEPYQGEDRNKIPIGGMKLLRINPGGASAGVPAVAAAPPAPLPAAASAPVPQAVAPTPTPAPVAPPQPSAPQAPAQPAAAPENVTLFDPSGNPGQYPAASKDALLAAGFSEQAPQAAVAAPPAPETAPAAPPAQPPTPPQAPPAAPAPQEAAQPTAPVPPAPPAPPTAPAAPAAGPPLPPVPPTATAGPRPF